MEVRRPGSRYSEKNVPKSISSKGSFSSAGLGGSSRTDAELSRSIFSSRAETSSSKGTAFSSSSRTGFSVNSALIMSASSSLLRARTLTICTSPGVRICFWDTRRLNLGCSKTMTAETSRPDSSFEILNLNHGKALAEIDSLHFWVIAKLLGSTGTENPAFVNDVSTIGNREGLAHVVVGDQNTNAAGLKVGDDPLQLQHCNRINTGKRLVKQDERRRNTEATRDLHAATFSTRQSIPAILPDNPKAELIDERFHALTPLVP